MANNLGRLMVLTIMTALPTLALNPLKMISNQIPRLMAQVDRLESCPEYPETPIQFENLVISQVGFNKFSLKGKIIIKETLDRPMLELEMYRCSSKDDPGSCEYYFTYREREMCELLERQDKTWNYFTNGTDLPRKCPFLPKTYTIDGSIIDLKEVKTVPFFQSHWMLKNKGLQDDKLMFCIISEFTLQMTTKH